MEVIRRVTLTPQSLKCRLALLTLAASALVRPSKFTRAWTADGSWFMVRSDRLRDAVRLAAIGVVLLIWGKVTLDVADYSPSRPIARNFEIVDPNEDAVQIKS